MDFSKVRLDFGKARLRGLPSQGAEPPAASKKAQSEEPPVAIEADVPGEVVAHAPQYKATLTLLSSDAERASSIQGLETDATSGYTLAVTPDGVLVWKRGNDSTLLFPLPPAHDVQALFVPPAAGEPASQPGLVLVDRISGETTYWESVSRAVVSGVDAHIDTRIPLDHRSSDAPEIIEFVELVAPVGIAIGTSHGKFHLVYLRDSLGRRDVRVAPLQPSNGLLARIRSIGAYSRDTSCVRAGRALSNGERELYIMNMYGDLSLWRVGLSGTAVLAQEVQVGAMLHMHMNILYPNSGLSLVVHDVAVENSYTHVLATFAPRHDSNVLYFVVASLTPELDIVSVQRFQSHESPNGVLSKCTALHVVDGVLCAVLDTALTFLDSPSRTAPGEPRWEETVALKQNSRVISSTVSQSMLIVATNGGFVSFHFTADRGNESTTQSRLEQAVFGSSTECPLDLTQWPPWEFAPDPQAPKELALKIATSDTPFLPEQLPDLLAHLELRVHALERLHNQCAIPDVRDIAQTVNAAAAVRQQNELGVGEQLVEAFAKDNGMSVRDLFLSKVLSIPQLVTLLATKVSVDPSATKLFLKVLHACDRDHLGTPQWAFTPAIRSAVEMLAAQAADAADTGLLADTVTFLCSISPPDLLNSESTRLLESLARLGSAELAIQIARRFKVFTAIAAIETNLWLESVGNERTDALSSVRSLISEFGEPLATAVYDACVEQGQVAVLVKELAPLDAELAESIELYLESRKMYSVAWTLEPATHHSTELLGKALDESSSVDARRLFASLYKLSALSVGADETKLAVANRELDLVAAQESIATQYYKLSSLPSAIARHAFASMAQSKPLSRNEAVELLALAPPVAPAESNDNFIRAFKLVDAQDTVRQQLLLQQLICNTNWEPVDSARDEQRRAMAMRQTLFFHTLVHVAPAYAALLSNPQSTWFRHPSPEKTQDAFPWDANSAVYAELIEISQLAESIANKYDVPKWISYATDVAQQQSTRAAQSV